MKILYPKINISIRIYFFIFLCFCTTSHAQSINQQSKFDGYLFAYFEGTGQAEQQEQLRFAISQDAIHWTALNNNLPILSSSEISQTGGIRDPHILRGTNDTSFYIVATDLVTRKNGWESNPGIILMKSTNLVDWKQNNVDLEKTIRKNLKMLNGFGRHKQSMTRK